MTYRSSRKTTSAHSSNLHLRRHRVWKEYNGSRTYFLYAGGIPVCEMDSAGNVIATNTFGVNGLLNRHDGSGTAFYTFDPQGNVVQQLNSMGTVTSTSMYDAFGSRVTTTPVSPFGYGGQSGYYTDPETGLVLLTHRYYDPQEGRFLTRDPIGWAGGINLYAYVGNNPVNLSDPLGLMPIGQPYWEAVGDVFRGYGDALNATFNPVCWYNTACGLYDLASVKGLWGAAKVAGRGMAKPFMPWTWSDDPREFGRNFGGLLIAAAAAGAGGAEAGASGASTPRPFMDVLKDTIGNERGSISMRGLWEVTEEGTSAVVRHATFGKIYQSASDGTWWSHDLAGHGGSAWKVFRGTKRGLEWIADADEYGTYIGGKHKGATGMFIPWGDLGGAGL